MDQHDIDPDGPPSLDIKPLTAYELEVEAHWQRCHPQAMAQLRAEGGERAVEVAVRTSAHRAQVKNALEAERRLLIAELKRFLADVGNAGLSNAEFLAGARTVPSASQPELRAPQPSVAGRPPFPLPSLTGGASSTDAGHARIDREMDAAFRKNVAKARAEREARKQAGPGWGTLSR